MLLKREKYEIYSWFAFVRGNKDNPDIDPALYVKGRPDGYIPSGVGRRLDEWHTLCWDPMNHVVRCIPDTGEGYTLEGGKTYGILRSEHGELYLAFYNEFKMWRTVMCHDKSWMGNLRFGVKIDELDENMIIYTDQVISMSIHSDGDSISNIYILKDDHGYVKLLFESTDPSIALMRTAIGVVDRKLGNQFE